MPGNGWVKLHREITEHWVFEDPEKLKLWIELLTSATHKKHKQNVGYELVELEPGELVFGTISFSKKLNISQNKIYKTIKLFENDGMIEYDTNSYQGKFSIVKIKNWEKYQKGKSPAEQGEGQNQQKVSKSPPKGKQKGNDRRPKASQKEPKTNNNAKNGKNGKKNNNIVPKKEIKKIYNSLPGYWTGLFEDYIDLYRAENKTNKITNNKHHRLLNEVYGIFKKMEFEFNGKEYELTKDIFEKGLETTVEAGAANINYAKKVWISEMERGNKNGKQISKNNRRKEEKPGESIFANKR